METLENKQIKQIPEYYSLSKIPEEKWIIKGTINTEEEKSSDTLMRNFKAYMTRCVNSFLHYNSEARINYFLRIEKSEAGKPHIHFILSSVGIERETDTPEKIKKICQLMTMAYNLFEDANVLIEPLTSTGNNKWLKYICKRFDKDEEVVSWYSKRLRKLVKKYAKEEAVKGKMEIGGIYK